jgi:hypothetical protein
MEGVLFKNNTQKAMYTQRQHRALITIGNILKCKDNKDVDTKMFPVSHIYFLGYD